MTSTRDLDYAPLTRTTGLGARVRAARAHGLMVVVGTVGVLLVLVPPAVLAGLLATGNATDVGALVLLAMVFAGGVSVLVDVLRRSGGGAVLDEFARVNDLVLVRGAMVPHYRGSLFADRTHAVHRSVRTRGEHFVEVGERLPVTAPDGLREPNRPRLFLRARLAGRPHGDVREAVTPALHDALTGLAGEYVLEVADDELTLFGHEALDPERAGRVREAFLLVEELVERVETAFVPAPREDGPGSVPHAEPPQGRPRTARAVVGLTLALVLGGPVVIAVVMSVLDDVLQGSAEAARMVVSGIVLAAIAAAAWVTRAAMTARRAGRGRARE